MKIGLIGTAGVGKTTLAEKISERFNIPVVKETVRDWLKCHNISLEDINKKENQNLLWQMQQDIINEKIKTELSLDDFVSDRTTIDSVAYALDGCDFVLKSEMIAYMEKCLNHMKNYDVVYFLVLPVDKDVILDGVRNTSQIYHLKIEKIIKGLVSEFAFFFPNKVKTIYYDDYNKGTQLIIEDIEKRFNK